VIEFRFGPWLPDATDYKNPGLEVCKNALPSPGGYQPALGPSSALADVGAPVLSARSFERKDATRIVVCATAGDLHVIIGGVVTNSGLALTLTAAPVFEQFGASIWATEKNGGTWVLANVESGSTFVAVTNIMPSAKALWRVGDFLFAGNLIDTDTSDQPYRIRWSPYNNPGGDWETDIGTQSDAVDMPFEYGPVMGGSGWGFAVILQRTGISRIVYTGGTSVFNKEVVDRQRGCSSSASIVAVGDRVFFLADDGFFYTDGGPSQPISRGRVWRWFLENVGQTYLENVKGAVDWPNRCVVWTLPNEDGVIFGRLYFNWETEQWSYVDGIVDCLFASGKEGLTLEQVAALYPDLDDMTLSLDSPLFRASGRLLAAFINGEQVTLTGDTLEFEAEVGEMQVVPGQRCYVTEVMPLITNPDSTTRVELRGRTTQNEDYAQSSEESTGPLGFAPFNFDARYYRVRFVVPAGTLWRDAYGFQIEAGASGW
jgi:hypothetical protein